MILTIYSIFVFVFIGYMAKVLRLLGNKQSGILLGFLLNFALPAQIFHGTYHANINLEFLLICLAGLLCNATSAFIVFMIARFLKFDRNLAITLCYLVVLGNTLYLGLPFVEGVLGSEVANQVVIYDQIITGIPFAFLAPILLSLGGKGRFSFRAIGVRLFKSPLFLALITGIALKIIHIEIPDDLFTPLRRLAQTATPLALFAVGVQMEFKSFLNWKLPSLVLAIKMIISPLLLCIVVMFLGYIRGIHSLANSFDDSWRLALIEVTMPPTISSAAIMLKVGFNGRLALNAVVLGIFVSFLIVPMWVYISYL